MKRIVILGSTGSIGTQTLDVVRANPGEFEVVGLVCGRNTGLLRAQLAEFSPRMAVCAERADMEALRADFPAVRFACGMDGICSAAALPEADIVVNALIGMMGVLPTFAAISTGHDIAFANKETLVAGGRLIMDAVREKGVKLLPVDSEHSAIFQCLQGSAGNPVKKILLTASGGPFRGYTAEQLKGVTLEQALHHPRWNMGAKITVDSATMMNKGLEIIEAAHLFSIAPSRIEVVVHPQSVLHSAVEFADGSVIGQLGAADMRIPIAYALSYPKRLADAGRPLDLFSAGTLTFEKPDPAVFRCLGLAYAAIAAGHSHQICLNAANEEAVAAFLAGQIPFHRIADVVEEALTRHEASRPARAEDVLAVDDASRKAARAYLRTLQASGGALQR